MVILGLVLLILGLIVGVPLLFWIGLILLIVGLVLNFAGPVDSVGTRRRYY